MFRWSLRTVKNILSAQIAQLRANALDDPPYLRLSATISKAASSSRVESPFQLSRLDIAPPHSPALS